MSIYDWGSASGASSRANYAFPFNKFDLPTCHSAIEAHYNSEVYTFFHIWGSNALVQHKTASPQLLGKNNGIVTWTNANTYVKWKYVPKYAYKTEAYSGQTKIETYGDAHLGSLSMNIYITVDSADYYLPMGYGYSVNVKSGTFFVDNKVKFLPGSNCYVSQGATIKVNANAIFYESRTSNTGTSGSVLSWGSSWNTPAVIYNSGTIDITNGARVGGIVKSYGQNATVVQRNTTFTGSEVVYETNSGGSAQYGFQYDLNGTIAFTKSGGAKSATNKGVFQLNTTYNAANNVMESYSSSNAFWYSQKIIDVSFDSITDATIPSVAMSTDDTDVNYQTSINLGTISSTLSIPNKQISGWTTDPDRSTTVGGFFDYNTTITLAQLSSYCSNDSVTLYDVWDIEEGLEVIHLVYKQYAYENGNFVWKDMPALNYINGESIQITNTSASTRPADVVSNSSFTTYEIDYWQVKDADNNIVVDNVLDGTSVPISGIDDQTFYVYPVFKVASTITPKVTLSATSLSNVGDGSELSVSSVTPNYTDLLFNWRSDNTSNVQVMVDNSNPRKATVKKGANNSNANVICTVSLADGREIASASCAVSTSGGGCVLPNTLITLADGSQTEARFIKKGDLIKTWSFFTGKYEVKPVIALEKQENTEFNVITIRLSNGQEIEMATYQSFFNTST